MRRPSGSGLSDGTSSARVAGDDRSADGREGRPGPAGRPRYADRARARRGPGRPRARPHAADRLRRRADRRPAHQDYRSALALAAIGKPAVEGLRGLLGEQKENVRAEVVMALGRIGPDAGAGRPRPRPLCSATRASGSGARPRRARADRPGGGSSRLIAASADRDVKVRAGAVEAPGAVGRAGRRRASVDPRARRATRPPRSGRRR